MGPGDFYVPGDASRFVGRGRELRRLRALFDGGASVVVLVGPGGAGKSRLAREWARASAADHAGGTWLCDAGAATSIPELCSVVAHALRARCAGSSDAMLRQLGEAIARRGRALLVLDGCEAAIEPVRAALGVWLGAAPSARILVTSRVRVGLQGEHAQRVEPLATPELGAPLERIEASDAVALLVDRLERLAPGARLDATTAPLLAELARLSGGLPLALELVAARVPVLGLAGLVERIRSDGLTLAASAPGSAQTATLEATIDASWRLLPAWGQSALAQLSVFASPFSPRDVERVLRLDDHPAAPPAVDVLGALVDASLLRVVPPASPAGEPELSHYDAVRELASRKAEALGVARSARERHAAHYVALGWDLRARARKGPDALNRLARALPNLLRVVRETLDGAPLDRSSIVRAASALLALEPLITRRGPFPWCLGLLERVVEEGRASLDDASLVGLLALRARLRAMTGELDAADADARLALSVAERSDRDALRAEAHLAAAFARWLRFDVDATQEHYARAAAHAAAAGDACAEVDARSSGAVVRVWGGRPSGAVGELLDALALARATGDRLREGSTLYALAWVELQLGNAEASGDYADQALSLVRELEDHRMEAATLECLACARRELDRFDGAREAFAASLRVSAASGNTQQNLRTRTASASTELLAGRTRTAYDELAAAVAELRRAGNERGEAEALGTYAFACAELGLHDEARATLVRARALARSAGEPLPQLVALAGVAADALAPNADRLRVRRRVRALLAGKEPVAPRVPELLGVSSEIRLARRLLGQALARSGISAEPARALEVSADFLTCSFRGERIDLSRRVVLARVLGALVRAHGEEDGRLLAVEELFTAGWPGERALPDAAANRVYVAVSRLRKLGLGDALVGSRKGYRLSPALVVKRA